MKTCQKNFPEIFKGVFVTLFAVFLVSCADTVETVNKSSDDNSEQLIAKVALFPAGYFNSGYVENYVITGTDDYGREYTGSYQIKTAVKDIFNGVEAIPVVSTLSYTTVINNVQSPPIVVSLTQYYSVTTPRQYLGNVNDRTSLILTLQNQAIDIPAMVISNSSGMLADLIGSNAMLETIGWSVSPNNSDTYSLSFDSTDTDSAGGLIIAEVQTFVISSSGERLFWSMTSEIPSLHTTLRFSGDRI